MKWSIAWPPRRATIGGAAAALVVLVLGAAGWLWYSAVQRRAIEAYALVLTRAEASRAPQESPEARAAAARDIEALLARYPSAPGVARAALDLGHLRYEARQYPQARAAYEIALARSPGSTIATLARLSIGYTWEGERNWAKAADAYRAALAGRGPRDFLYEETLIDLARVQSLAGQQVEAAETYRRLLKDRPGSRHSDEVKSRLADLPAATP